MGQPSRKSGSSDAVRLQPRWRLWQRMTRVLGTMAQVGLAQIGESPPPKLDLHTQPERAEKR